MHMLSHHRQVSQFESYSPYSVSQTISKTPQKTIRGKGVKLTSQIFITGTLSANTLSFLSVNEAEAAVEMIILISELGCGSLDKVTRFVGGFALDSGHDREAVGVYAFADAF